MAGYKQLAAVFPLGSGLWQTVDETLENQYLARMSHI